MTRINPDQVILKMISPIIVIPWSNCSSATSPLTGAGHRARSDGWFGLSFPVFLKKEISKTPTRRMPPR